MIRVAYDVSFAVPLPGKGATVTGVGRVIEELFKRLRVNPELDLKVVGGFGGDWNALVTSLSVEKWATTTVKPPTPFLKGYQVNSKLGELTTELLYRFQERASSANDKGLPALARARDFALAALRRFADSQVNWGVGRDQADVFHSTFRSPPDWLSPEVPRVVTVHDVIPLRYREDYDASTLGTLESVLASLRPSRDVATAVSQFTKDDFCSLSGFPPERVVVAPLSAGDHFRPIHDEARLEGVRVRLQLGAKPFLLSVSNPQPRKNIPLLIRSFYKVLRQLPSWEGNLVLVGQAKAGWGIEAIEEEIAKEPELARRIIRAGAVSDEDLASLYSACEAFLFPSTSEGFGLPVLEAMKCGAPVICSHSSSLPEVTGDAALTVDPRDEESLAEAIIKILINPGLRSEFVTRSVQRAARFSWESTAEKIVEAYRMALNPLERV